MSRKLIKNILAKKKLPKETTEEIILKEQIEEINTQASNESIALESAGYSRYADATMLTASDAIASTASSSALGTIGYAASGLVAAGGAVAGLNSSSSNATTSSETSPVSAPVLVEPEITPISNDPKDISMHYTYGSNGDLRTASYDYNNDGTIDFTTRYTIDSNGLATPDSQDTNQDGMADFEITDLKSGIKYPEQGNLTGYALLGHTSPLADGETIKIYSYGGYIGDAIVDSDGNWRFDGLGMFLSYDFEARIVKADGLTVARDIVIGSDIGSIIEIQEMKGSTSSANPWDTYHEGTVSAQVMSTFFKGNIITGENNNTIEFYIDGKYVGDVTDVRGYNWYYSIPDNGDSQNHTYEARVVDRSGKTLTSDQFVPTPIDIVEPPVVEPEIPHNHPFPAFIEIQDMKGSSSSANPWDTYPDGTVFAQVMTIFFKGATTADIKATPIEFYIDGEYVGNVRDVAEDGTWYYSISDNGDSQNHTYEARVVDRDGNTLSSNKFVPTPIDIVEPPVAWVDPQEHIQIEKIDKDKDGIFEEIVETEYTSDGGQIVKSTFDTDDNGVIEESNVISYDIAGNVTSQTFDYNYDGQTDLKSVFEYDANNKLISVVHDYTNDNINSKDMSMHYTYGSNGDLRTASCDYNNDGIIDFTTRYSIDSNGLATPDSQDTNQDGMADFEITGLKRETIHSEQGDYEGSALWRHTTPLGGGETIKIYNYGSHIGDAIVNSDGSWHLDGLGMFLSYDFEARVVTADGLTVARDVEHYTDAWIMPIELIDTDTKEPEWDETPFLAVDDRASETILTATQSYSVLDDATAYIAVI